MKKKERTRSKRQDEHRDDELSRRKQREVENEGETGLN